MRIFLLLSFFSFSAFAEPTPLVVCHARNPSVKKLDISLFQDERGKVTGGYVLGNYPYYSSSWVNAGAVTTPPVSLSRLMDSVNAYRDTGLRAEDVKLFQNTFIDGTDHWDIELWKLMDARGRLLGWMAYAYGKPLGCY